MKKQCYRLIFSSLELDWADLGAHFKNFILNMVVTYQNRSFSWTNNKMGSEVEKIVRAHFSLRWAVLRAHFKISIQLLVVTNQNRSFSWTIRSGKNCSRSLLDHQWYIEAVGLMWVFLELLVVTVLSVSHLVAFIRVGRSTTF